MKQSYDVYITRQIKQIIRVDDCNSPEEAENVAEAVAADFDTDDDGCSNVLESEILEIEAIPAEYEDNVITD